MNATRKTFGLAKVFAVFISLLFACTLLMSSVCAQPAFAGTTDETLLGTMTIQLDTSEPDNPNPDPDNPNPNPNPDDNGNGDNGDGSGSNANIGDGNNGNSGDVALKASAYNGKNGKGFLSNTGDVVSTVLIALFALSAVFLGCIYLSRRRAVTTNGTDSSFDSKSFTKLRTAFVAMLAAALIAGGVMSALKAFADGDVTDAGSSNMVDATSTVIVDKDGNVKSTSITLQNKLKTPVTVKSISAPTELSTWTSTIDANTEIAAEGETSGTWNTGDGKIPDSILKQLSEENPSIELSFESEVSYTSYDVTWSANGGNGVFDTTPVPANGNVVLPANEPTREHYTFAGWNKDADGNGEEVTENTVVTGDVTFYAKWTPETYKISYEFPDGGEFAGGVTPEDSYTYGVGVDSFEEPYKQGYDFDGWYDAETGGNKVTSISTTDFGDKTLYARWTPGTHTKYRVQHILEDINTDGKYGLNTSTGVTEEYGTTGQMTNAQPKSYTGFEVREIGKEVIKGDGSKSVNIKYDRIKYAITFDNNGIGPATLAPITVKYQRKLSKPNTILSFPGYTFDGWYDNKDCTGNEFDYANTPIIKDTTLYAKWTPITYKVKFDKNDTAATGTMEDQSFTYDKAQKLTKCSFIKPNATFLGWAETADGEVKYTDAKEVKNLSSAGGETITLYAKWKDTPTYTVTYDASGGTDAIMTGAFAQSDGGGITKTDDHKLRADETIGGAGGSAKNFQPVPNDTNNEGYVFVGWYTEPNGGGEEAVVATTKVTKDTTFYACYLGTTFMAPASQSTANARKITGGRKYTLSYAKTAATAFAGSDTTSTLYNQFNDWMTNDSYHLYTLLKGADGNFLDPALTDSWIEFRIVHIGEKDTSDGTGLTFQAIHSLPVGYQMNSISTIEGGWDSSELKRKMNTGEIFDSFDPRLTSITVPLSRGKLWIASYSEVTGNDQYNVKDGEQFLFLKNKVQLSGGGNRIVDLGKTRSGYKVHMYGSWWLRTTSPDDGRKAFHTVTGGGYISGAGGSYPVILFVGVVPCFSL